MPMTQRIIMEKMVAELKVAVPEAAVVAGVQAVLAVTEL
jgi:hypothetical protein